MSYAASSGNGPPMQAFHLHLDILNKEEVVANKIDSFIGGQSPNREASRKSISASVASAVPDEVFRNKVAQKLLEQLPPKLQEKAGIAMAIQHMQEGCSGRLLLFKVQLISYQLSDLGAKGLNLGEKGGEEFARLFRRLPEAFRKMEMPQKALEVQNSVNLKIRWRFMQKLLSALPQELQKEPIGLKVRLTIPELIVEDPPPNTENPDKQSMASMGLGDFEAFLLQAEIKDRQAILEERYATGRKRDFVKKNLAAVVPDMVFERALEQKLQKQIPELLLERAGIEASCRRLRRRDERRNAPADMPTEGILIEVQIDGVDAWPPVKLLNQAKGQTFTEGFTELWETLLELQQLGVPNMTEKILDVMTMIKARIHDGVQVKLLETLSERLHATVTVWEGDKVLGFRRKSEAAPKTIS